MATTIGLPTLKISFEKAAAEVASRSKKGYVAMFVRDSNAQGVYLLNSTALIPTGLGEDNKKHILTAFEGSDRGSPSLVILDLKEIDPEKHRQLTGRDNANILAMARHISDLGVPLWIRHVLVPGLTDDEEGLRRTADFIRSLKTVQRVEVLPYHTLGLFKWQKLGISYPLPDAVPPTAEQVRRAEELLEVAKYPG